LNPKTTPHVLVTGAAGFLGGATVRAFEKMDYRVSQTARNETAACQPLDLADVGALATTLDHCQPEIIVNCAAIADFGPGVLARQFATNTLAPGVMAAWCERNGAHMIQISGTLVHGFNHTSFGPATLETPDTDYGRSKYLAEKLVSASGASATILRFGGIFGLNGPDHLFLNRMIRAARSGMRPTITGHGQARRNYLHVEDAAAMITYCATHRSEGIRWAGGSDILSIQEMAQAVCDAFIGDGGPVFTEGVEARDQIVETSDDLPQARPFVTALRSAL